MTPGSDCPNKVVLLKNLKVAKMQILSVTNCPLDPKLGSGKTVLMFTQGLRELGHKVDVLEPKEYEVLGWVRRGIKFRQAWGAWQAVQTKLRQKKYDLIEFYGDEFWLSCAYLKRQKSRPFLVAHTNGLELLASARAQVYNPAITNSARLHYWLAKQTHQRFSRLAFASTDAFVSLSRLDCEFVLTKALYQPERTAIVAPGIDSEYLQKTFEPAKENRIAFTGSWILRKGIDNLVRVAQNLLKRYPTLELDIFGANVSTDMVLEAFEKIFHQRIKIYPRLANSEIAEKLCRAKVFFFPTRYEGFGIALAEAMACGCAVVTTPTGFGAELNNGAEGLIHPFEDLINMEQSISRLLDDEHYRTKIAFAGYQRVQSLVWESSIRQLETLYQNWLNEEYLTPTKQLIGTL
jgi:glycosyltransferase involved in cell wall biosynthesis